MAGNDIALYGLLAWCRGADCEVTMNTMIPIIIPVHSSEPEQIKCPKCGERFVPPDKSDPPLFLKMILVLFIIAVVVGCGWGGWAIFSDCFWGYRDYVGICIGIFLMGIDACIFIGGAIDLFTE